MEDHESEVFMEERNEIESSIASIAPLRSAITSRVESCLFHRGNFPGEIGRASCRERVCLYV